ICQLIDSVAAIATAAPLAVDEGDTARAGGGVEESGIVAEQPRILRRRADLAEVGGADRPVLDRQLVVLAGPAIDDQESLGGVGYDRREIRGHGWILLPRSSVWTIY